MSDAPKEGTGTEEIPFVRVECYAGHRADTEPRRLLIGQRAVAVTEILDRWLDPHHRYFKLRGDDGGIYLVRHDALEDRWELTLYDSGRRAASRLSSNRADPD